MHGDWACLRATRLPWIIRQGDVMLVPILAALSVAALAIRCAMKGW